MDQLNMKAERMVNESSERSEENILNHQLKRKFFREWTFIQKATNAGEPGSWGQPQIDRFLIEGSK